MLEHPLSALYDVAHGAGLALLFPLWLRYRKETIIPRILQFGRNILDMEDEIEGLSDTNACDTIISRFAVFIRSIIVPQALQKQG